MRMSAAMLLPRAAEDDHVHGVIHARLEDARIQLLVHLVGVGVRRGIVQLEDRHSVFDAIIDEVFSHFRIL
jgi:hypothetical protein